MLNKTITLVAAMARNGAIGLEGRMPWHLPAELKHFKKTTLGKPVVMGRKTWESIGRSLPGRQSIVLSRDPSYRAEGCLVVQSLDEALAAAGGDDEVFVVGGAAIYALALASCNCLYVTQVHAEIEGDVDLPPDVLDGFRLVREESHEPDEKNQYAYSFRVYERAG